MFALSDRPIDPAALRASLDAADAGGVVIFEGQVRGHSGGRAVAGLDYEAYPELAQAEGDAILAAAIARHGLVRATCVHRVGPLCPGELAIWIGVSAPHRAAAFDGCREIIEQVKARLPVWKHERFADGGSHWVNAS